MLRIAFLMKKQCKTTTTVNEPDWNDAFVLLTFFPCTKFIHLHAVKGSIQRQYFA